MPINKDIRSYADTALDQGKQVLGQAQTQLTDVTEQARNNVAELTAKAADAVHDLVTQAEKAVNLDAIRATIEPYIAQAKGYSTTVSGRAEDAFATAKTDKRLAKLVTTAESLTGVFVGTVQERIVKPVRSMTGRGRKPAAKAAATRSTSKPAAAAPARKATTVKAAPKKAAPKKAASRKASTVKAAAKKAAPRRAATVKAPAKKAATKS